MEAMNKLHGEVMELWPFKGPQQKYVSVADEEGEGQAQKTKWMRSAPGSRGKIFRMAVWILVLANVVAIPAGAYWYFGGRGSQKTADSDLVNDVVSEWPAEGDSGGYFDVDTNSTTRCPQRHEWRTLSREEQQEYIRAVLCLRTIPSVLQPALNRSSYDDWPLVHSHVGYTTHNSAPFLPWHRYFLHLYEKTLRGQCGYSGALPFWDWTMDSMALEMAPVFSAADGFGGDGEVDGNITVGRTGRCVVDGPFAGITAEYYDVKYKPHCLSRGFRDFEGELGHMNGQDVTRESIEEVLELNDYEDFVVMMESKVHNAIPFGIGGDFETFTAPYDPVFFLHHTQLDRLWWEWQQRQPNNGTDLYYGHKERHSMEMASLDDEIDMMGLAPRVQVKQVMDTEGGILCYTYSNIE
ncbi:hypothetical protein BAUCODRAFT_36350 [Baudoinia panamericana UAMH 10762]|uniref:Tyrosinase copper-binding domain-containing protein n=1 Tax=Baudoinia panamericana (strain UAMH 10762) TaxID=717646 RepID=M2MQZ6_BAUPA|nr:uncharacterized protein BAUCODRAFT_36350 [Baudoinia panamericana UAMH 10762]EMC93898.1 hypothetical protein BAUCODRAFT_36350 [Baudoinia panamericana UAMH 10762]